MNASEAIKLFTRHCNIKKLYPFRQKFDGFSPSKGIPAKPQAWCRMSLVVLLLFSCFFIIAACSKSGDTAGQGMSSASLLIENMGNGSCREVSSGLMWQIERSTQFATWKEADAYVKTMSHGGFNDWRLPTYDESYRLAELLLMEKKADCPIKIKKSFWVSDNGKKGKAGYWEDYPLCGGPELRWVKSSKGSVLAVRP
ncbi:MAG: DUF1566 domain-containing protein [Desulfobulbaceae bacterium]|nr:DUF1566 domain-containing protein [Desulfobulbaceae bacterium]